MPISRVRSATATSMMFMITIAPTTSPIAGSTMPPIMRCLLDRLPARERRLRRLEHEVVRLRRVEMVPRAHDLACALLRSRASRCRRRPARAPACKPRGFDAAVQRRLCGAMITGRARARTCSPVSAARRSRGTESLRASAPFPADRCSGNRCRPSFPITTTGAPTISSCSVNTRPSSTSRFLMKK